MAVKMKWWSTLLIVGVCSMALGACVKKDKDAGKKGAGGKGMKAADKSAAMAAKKTGSRPAAMGAGMEADMGAARPATPRVTAMGPAKATGGAYTLKFDRPVKVGMFFHVKAQGSHSVETKMDGKLDPSASFKYSFVYEGVEIIKAVGATGMPTHVEHTVVKLTLTHKGKTTALLPPATGLDFRAQGDDLVIKAGGRPASQKVMSVVQDMVDLRGQRAVSTDAVFNPGVPKKPGDTWKPNTDKLLASLVIALKKSSALMPKVSDVTGQVSLVGPQKMDGVDGVLVKSIVDINNIAPKMGLMKVTGGTMKIAHTYWLPQDANAVNNGVQTAVSNTVRGQVTQGGKTRVKTTSMYRHKKMTRKLVPKADAAAITPGTTPGSTAGAPGGGAGKVDCEKMCTKTFKTCLTETLVTSGKLTRQAIERIKKVGALKKVQQAGYDSCKKACTRKKGFGADAAEINKCLAIASCAKYAKCVKKHIR